MKDKIKNIGNTASLIFLGLAILASLFFLIATIISNKNLKETKMQEKETLTDGEKFKAEYEKLNDQDDLFYMEIKNDNIIEYIDYEEINEILDAKTGVIYIGLNDCNACRQAITIMLQAAENIGLDKIHYLNIKNDRKELQNDNGNIRVLKEGTENYNKLVKRIGSYLLDYEDFTNYKRIYVPTFIFVKDGNIIDVNSIINEDTIFSKEQRNNVYNLYINNIKQIIE